MIRYTLLSFAIACAGPVTQPDTANVDAGPVDSSVCTEVRVVCIRELGATDDVCVSETEVTVVVPCQGQVVNALGVAE